MSDYLPTIIRFQKWECRLPKLAHYRQSLESRTGRARRADVQTFNDRHALTDKTARVVYTNGQLKAGRPVDTDAGRGTREGGGWTELSASSLVERRQLIRSRRTPTGTCLSRIDACALRRSSPNTGTPRPIKRVAVLASDKRTALFPVSSPKPTTYFRHSAPKSSVCSPPPHSI